MTNKILEKLMNSNNYSNIMYGSTTNHNDKVIIVSSHEEAELIDKLWDLYNNHPTDQIKDLFDTQFETHEVVYDDEYIMCDNCYKYICTTCPYDNYHINRSGEITCAKCIKENKNWAYEYIKELINNPKKANQIIKLPDFGYVKVKDNYRSGLHTGDDSNPKDISKILKDKNIDHIFNIEDVDMFTVEFSLYVKKGDVKKYNKYSLNP